MVPLPDALSRAMSAARAARRSRAPQVQDDDLAIRTADEANRARRADVAQLPAARIVIDTHSVWLGAWAVVAVVALAGLAQFVLTDGAAVIFAVVMSYFLAIAMEPAVSRLSRVLPRPAATAVVMVLGLAALVAFVMIFGALLRDQVVLLVTGLPGAVTSLVAWINETFHSDLSTDTILQQVNLDTDNVTRYATTLAGGLLNVLSSIASAALSTFTFLFLTYYFSAHAPRLRSWLAGLFPPRQQVVVLTVWELAVTKVGGYVGARLVLAAINGSTTAVFLWAIGMDSWLPLGIWTGLVAQFVPTVGTYLAILLPVLVGLSGPEPQKGLWVLLWAIAYQQVENLTFEPRISAKAVDVHPAVAFASVLMGAALFGVAGALVGVPVAAALIALFDIYKQRYALSQRAEQLAHAAARQEANPHEADDAEIEDVRGGERPPDSVSARTLDRATAGQDRTDRANGAGPDRNSSERG